jgi:integrase
MLVLKNKTYHSRIMFENKLYCQSLKTKSETVAIREDALLYKKIHDGDYLDTRKTPTLFEFAHSPKLNEHFQTTCEPRSVKFYQQNLKTLVAFPPFQVNKLSKISASMIKDFSLWRAKQVSDQSKELVTKASINNAIRTLRRVLILAQEWGMIKEVPTIHAVPNKNDKREEVLSDGDMQRMIELSRKVYPCSRFYLLLPFLMSTGLRIGEACALLKEDVTFDGDGIPASIQIVKSKSAAGKRIVHLTPRAGEALAACLKISTCEFVFTKGTNGEAPIDRLYPSFQFRTLKRKLGLAAGLVLHCSRHSFCSNLINKGVNLAVVRDLAGHSSVQITARYVHPDAGVLKDAINMLP